VWCQSSALCVAVGGQSLRTSVSPTGRPAAWRSVPLYHSGSAGPSLNGVACATPQLCVAVDGSGGIIAATNPAGGWSAWSKQTTASAGLNAVSCAPGPLCVAVDSAGGVTTSTNPTSGAAAWSRAVVDAGHQLTALSCPSVALCVATDDAGNVVSSTNPTAGADAWSVARVDQGHALTEITGISCPSTAQCIAGDDGGRVLSSSAPAGGPSAWHVVATDHNDNGNEITGVSCGSEHLCVAVDSGGGVLLSTAPNDRAWRFAEVLPPFYDQQYDGAVLTYVSFAAVSCPSSRLCAAIAIGQAGGSAITSYAEVSNNPTNGRSWGDPTLEQDQNVNAISCPSTKLCVAVDAIGQAFVATSP
jgi:hypothetical protein